MHIFLESLLHPSSQSFEHGSDEDEVEKEKDVPTGEIAE